MAVNRRSKLLWAAVLGAVLVGTGAAVWRSLQPADVRTPGVHDLRPEDPKVVAAGQQVYVAHCAACHGAKLEGQPDWKQRRPNGRLPAPPHDATGHTWHHPDEQLFRMTKLGVARTAGIQGYESDMPAFEGVLSDAQIIAVLSWIKAQWPDAVHMQHNAINRRARAGY